MNECTFRVPDQRGRQPKGQLIDDHPGCSLSTHLRTGLDVSALAGGCEALLVFACCCCCCVFNLCCGCRLSYCGNLIPWFTILSVQCPPPQSG